MVHTSGTGSVATAVPYSGSKILACFSSVFQVIFGSLPLGWEALKQSQDHTKTTHNKQ